MILSDVNEGVYVPRGPKRVGRGCGSGHGKTSSRGHKGQGSRRGCQPPSRFPGVVRSSCSVWLPSGDSTTRLTLQLLCP